MFLASSHFQRSNMGAVRLCGVSDSQDFFRFTALCRLVKIFSSGFLKKIFIGVLFALFCAFIQCDLMSAPVLSITQSPSLSISSSNLSGAGGTDLTATLASTPMTLVFTVNDSAATNTVWSCYCSINNASSNWPPNLVFNIKLTNPGSSNATSSTGGGFAALNASQQKICSGSGNGSGITLQCLLANVSLANCPPTTSTAYLPITLTLNSS